MSTPDQLVAVLEGWLAEGVHEVPTHSNHTKIGAEFGWDGVAWCAETCSVAMKHVGLLGFWTASVAQAIADATAGKNGLIRIPRAAEIRRGDFVTFDWKGAGNPSDFHISTVVDPGTQAKFLTIGGNENDAVTKQWRDRTYVSGFIRPRYDAAPAQEDDDMAFGDHQQTQLDELQLAVEHFQKVFDTWEPIILGMKPGESVDVDKLAAALSDRLGEDVAKALGEKLSA